MNPNGESRLNGASQIAKRLELLWREAFRPWKWRYSLTGIGLVVALASAAAGWGLSKARAADVPTDVATDVSSVEMKRYVSPEWHFAIDIPKNWNAVPTVPSNSRFEVNRFASEEDGTPLLIIFCQPLVPAKSLTVWVEGVQEALTKGGYANFVTNQTTIGSKPVATLDFDKLTRDGHTWYVREYFVSEETYGYCLGFGSTKRSAMVDLYSRITKSFQVQE